MLRVCKGNEQPKKKQSKKETTEEAITDFSYLKINKACDWKPDASLVAQYNDLPYEFKSYFPKTHPELGLLIEISNNLKKVDVMERAEWLRINYCPNKKGVHLQSYLFELFKTKESQCDICLSALAKHLPKTR